MEKLLTKKKRGLLKLFSKTYAYLKIWLGTGQSYFYDFRYPIILAIALKVYLPNLNAFTMGLIALAIIIFFIFVGWFDLKYIRISQTLAEIQTREYNPYFQQLERKI